MLASVQKQFERLSEQSEQDLVLILFEPGPGVSLKDALLMCPLTRDRCPDGPPDIQSIARIRRTDERTIQEFIYASPYAGRTRGEFLKLASDAGNCLGDWSKKSGVTDVVLGEKGAAVRWMKLLFSFALDQPEFPARTKWDFLNPAFNFLVPDWDGSSPPVENSGRYAVISDAVRCSQYAIDGLNASVATSPSLPESSETAIDAEHIRRLFEVVLEENSLKILAIVQNSKLNTDRRMRQICEIDVRYWQKRSPFWATAFGVTPQAIRNTPFWREDRRHFLKRVQELSDDRYPER